MSSTIDENELIKIRNSLNKIADFIALYENVDEKLKAREESIRNLLQESENKISAQLNEIQVTLKGFEDIMTEAGAARWRIAAEQSLQAGEEHLNNIRLATDEFIEKTEQMYQKIDKMSEYTVKNIAKTINSFDAEKIQNVADQSVKRIQHTCDTSLERIQKVIHWFHWRNIALVLSITVMVTVMTGLYLNDEWPWEIHKEVKQQRNLAKAVIDAWPHLSHADQQEILQTATNQVT